MVQSYGLKKQLRNLVLRVLCKIHGDRVLKRVPDTVYTVYVYTVYTVYRSHRVHFMKYLGIDYGRARVGTAVSDDEGKIAFPRSVLKNTGVSTLAGAIASLAGAERVLEIVMGLPRVVPGMDASLRDEIQNLAGIIKKQYQIPISFQDELFTTRMAEEHSAKNADASAAALILQSFLDRKNRVS